jgi:hypothetical protein
MKSYSKHPAAVTRKERFDHDPHYRWRERRNTKVRDMRQVIEKTLNNEYLHIAFEDLVKHLHDMPTG